jgi:hypothetical protein
MQVLSPTQEEQMSSLAVPVAALGLGWIGVVIVVLIVIWLITRVF